MERAGDGVRSLAANFPGMERAVEWGLGEGTARILGSWQDPGRMRPDDWVGSLGLIPKMGLCTPALN